MLVTSARSLHNIHGASGYTACKYKRPMEACARPDPDATLHLPGKKPPPPGAPRARTRPRYTDKSRRKHKKDRVGGAEGAESQTPKEEKEVKEEEKEKEVKEKQEEKEEKKEEEQEEEQEEEDWDSLFADDGECLDPRLLQEEDTPTREARPERWSAEEEEEEEEEELGDEASSHIVEIYDFPAEFKTEDLIRAFGAYQQRGFDVKWIDDTHALGLFSSPVAVRDVLRTKHPMLKVRPLSKSSSSTRAQARASSDYLLPVKERPQTSAALARRLVAGALGVKSGATHEQREAERNQLRQARELKRLAAKQRDDAWEGK